MTRPVARPSCVVNIADLPAEKRPRFTQAVGVAAMLRQPSAATGLTRMGVHVRTVAPGLAGTHRHCHSVEEEWSYVLAGRGTVRIGPQRIAVGAGHFVGFPPGFRPHHFINDGNQPLVILEGGERRPSEDRGWYPDVRMMWREGNEMVEPYQAPPVEQGDAEQVVHLDDVEVLNFQHDVDPEVRRRMRPLHRPTGLERQAVYWSQVAPGKLSTVLHTHARTDEWVYVLAGRAIAQVGAERFDIGPGDFLGHPAGGPAHVMQAVDELSYLMGGQIDANDTVTYPDAGVERVAGRLRPVTDRP